MRYILILILLSALIISGCQEEKGTPCGSDFRPACYDKENIIICDNETKTIQIVDCTDLGGGFCQAGKCVPAEKFITLTR